MTFCGISTPPARLLLLILRSDLPSPALHLQCARMASSRCFPLALTPGVIATTGSCVYDIHDRNSPRSTSASLVLLFVSRYFYSTIFISSISSIVFLSIYTFIFFSHNSGPTSESSSRSNVALIRAASLLAIILLYKPPS